MIEALVVAVDDLAKAKGTVISVRNVPCNWAACEGLPTFVIIKVADAELSDVTCLTEVVTEQLVSEQQSSKEDAAIHMETRIIGRRYKFKDSVVTSAVVTGSTDIMLDNLIDAIEEIIYES